MWLSLASRESTYSGKAAKWCSVFGAALTLGRVNDSRIGITLLNLAKGIGLDANGQNLLGIDLLACAEANRGIVDHVLEADVFHGR